MGVCDCCHGGLRGAATSDLSVPGLSAGTAVGDGLKAFSPVAAVW